MQNDACACSSRRAVLGTGLAALGTAGAVGLSACGPGGSDAPASQAVPSPSGQGTALSTTEALPVGQQISVPHGKTEILLFRPSADTVLAYSAICPHAGCMAQPAQDETFHCPCHGSVFKQSDGSVVSGPAPRGLQRYATSIDAGKILVYLT